MKVKSIPENEWVERWPEVRLDQFKDISEMEILAMDRLNALCVRAERFHSWVHRINSDYRAGDPGMHGKGEAADIVFYLKKPGDVPVLKQFEFTESQGLFTRIGIYPFWNAPGLHVDIKDETLYWYRDKAGIYQYSKTPQAIMEWQA